MKYLILLALLAGSLLFILERGIIFQTTTVSHSNVCSPDDGKSESCVTLSEPEVPNKIVEIARQMRDVAACCQKLSSQEMKVKRLEFLKNNKSVTIQDLMNAIETKIDGKDVIEFLDSFDCDVCKEYAASLKVDYENTKKAIKSNFGNTAIETLMYWRLL